MAELIIWKTQEIDRLKKDMDRLLARFRDDFCSPLLVKGFREEPYLELSETQDDLLLKAEIADVRPKDLDITISDDLLTIRADVKREDLTEGEDPREDAILQFLFSHHPAPLQGPCRRGSSHLPGRHLEPCHA